MIIFQHDGFDEYYKGILSGEKSQGIYIDPDCTTDVGKTEYYKLLTDFLRKREKDFSDGSNMYSFWPPKEAKATSESEKRNELSDSKKIVVMDGNNPIFRLTSDQFGFSAVEEIYSDQSKSEKHPLSILLNRKNNENIRTLITNYVKNSRTLGGAFVWPIKKEGRRVCSYNMRRGLCANKDINIYQGYIEDRVDLTLLEIKHALDGEYDRGNFSSDILYDEYMKNDCMKLWLKHFVSFEHYYKYFMLEPFVVDGMPINIISGNAIREDEVLGYKEKFLRSKRGQLQDLDTEALIHVIKRMEEMIMSRTDAMEEILMCEKI